MPRSCLAPPASLARVSCHSANGAGAQVMCWASPSHPKPGKRPGPQGPWAAAGCLCQKDTPEDAGHMPLFLEATHFPPSTEPLLPESSAPQRGWDLGMARSRAGRCETCCISLLVCVWNLP